MRCAPARGSPSVDAKLWDDHDVSRPRTPATSPFHAVVDGVGAIGDTHVHAAIDTATRLDPELLRSALAALTVEIPRLGSKFQFRYLRCRWIPDAEPAWIIEERTVADEAAARSAEDELFALPFEPHGTLPVRLRLLHLPDRDRLLLRVNHLLADGGGVKNLCYRLARAYRQLRGVPVEPAPPRPPHPLWRLLRCFRPSRIFGLLYGAFEELTTALPKRPLGVTMPAGPPGQSRFERVHVPAERVERLVRRWKPRGVTLNDLALCAFTRALELSFPADNPPGRHVMLVVTADLRRYEPTVRDDVTNFSNLRPLFIGKTPSDEPEQHLQRVVRATRRWKRGLTGLLPGTSVIGPLMVVPDAWLRWLVARGIRILTGSGSCTALTNIGPIDATRLDFGDGPCLAAWVLVPIGRPPLLMSALSGCAGALDLSIAYKERALAAEHVRRLAQTFDEELTALEAHPP
jgi:NRPS condensation-like uncharacterized protein